MPFSRRSPALLIINSSSPSLQRSPILIFQYPLGKKLTEFPLRISQNGVALSKNNSIIQVDIINYDNFYAWTTTERNYMGIHEQFFRICREFGWTMKGGKL